MKRFLFIIFLTMICTTAGYADLSFVEKVIDGRTLKLISGERVRLIGVNLAEEKLKEVESFVRGLVSGAVVEVEYDVQERDEQGNLLGYVWFEYEHNSSLDPLKLPGNYDIHYLVTDDGDIHFFVLLNTTIIKSGYASPVAESPNLKYTQLFTEVYQQIGLPAQPAPSLANVNLEKK